MLTARRTGTIVSMNPNDQLPSPAEPPPQYSGGTNPQDPYAFIFNGNQKPKRSLGGGGMSKQTLLIVAAGGGLLLCMIILVVMLLFSGGGASDPVIKLAQTQNEVIRVSAIGVTNARGSKAQALATNANLATVTDQQKTLAFLKKQRKKLSAKELAASQNSKTDKTLTDAIAAGRFDDVFIDTMRTQLTQYQATIDEQTKLTKTADERALLKNARAEATTLLGSIAPSSGGTTIQ